MKRFSLQLQTRMNEQFKFFKCGIAHCLCCQQKVSVFEIIENEFWKHFSSKSHVDFLVKLYWKYNNNQFKEEINDNNKEAVIYQNNFLDENINQIFRLERNRLAFCNQCSETVILTESQKEEFIKHIWQKKCNISLFTNSAFEMILSCKQSLKKCEQSIEKCNYCQKNAQIKKQFKVDAKINNSNEQEKSLNNAQIQKLSNLNGQPNQNEQLRQNRQPNQNFQNPSLQFQKKIRNEEEEEEKAKYYAQVECTFEKFILDLIQKEYLLEAMCFILIKYGKSNEKICGITFAEVSQFIKTLAENNELSVELLNNVVEAGKKLWNQYGKSNMGYLLQQPYEVKKLQSLLGKVKSLFYIQTQDSCLKKLLANFDKITLIQFGKELKQCKEQRRVHLQSENIE